MPDLREIQAQLRTLRNARDRLRATVHEHRAELQAIDAILGRERRRGSRGPAATDLTRLEAQKADLEARLPEEIAELKRAKAAAQRAAANLLATPQTLIEELDDAVPFLLFPVRLETKFVHVDGRHELWVRIFPDDIAISTHEETLTRPEANDARDYWRERARANGLPTEAAQSAGHRGAWGILSSRYGPHRAAWIARRLKPVGWSPTHTVPEELEFPDPGPMSETGWTQPARTHVLPDRFFVATISDGTVIHPVLGRSIPDDLVLSPDPQQVEGTVRRDAATGRLIVDDDLRWLVDFESAVAVGMAVRIPLEEPWFEGGFDGLLVLGIRLSTDAQQGSSSVAALLEAHRYSRGWDLVQQGTATNNTDGTPSGLTSSADAAQDAFRAQLDQSPLIPESDQLRMSDAQRLAEALNLPFEVIQHCRRDQRDIAEALAMNRALYPATVGSFLRDLLAPLVDSGHADRLQQFFLRFVTGRGCLPAIRVGNQPYGLVVTSALGKWSPAKQELDRDGDFDRTFLGWLTTLAQKWRDFADEVSYAGKRGNRFKHLLSIIGLQASSVEFYSRNAVADEYSWNYLMFGGAPLTVSQNLWDGLQTEKRGLFQRLGIDADQTTFRLRNLTFFRRHDLLLRPVVEMDPRLPLSETDRISSYDGTHNYIDWLLLSSRQRIEAEKFTDASGRTIGPPPALLYEWLQRAYVLQLIAVGKAFLLRYGGQQFDQIPAEPAILNVSGEKVLTGADYLNVDTAKIGITRDSQSLGDYLVQHARVAGSQTSPLLEIAPLRALGEALRLLSTLPTARLERLFAEHVDVCSHRFDAWQSAVFQRRLAQLRAPAANGGIHIGAYGWIEELRPATRRRVDVPPQTLPPLLQAGLKGPVVEYDDNGGYMHCPSLTQAASAAVLRNAYLSHADADRATAMAVNLSSARVRTALSYCDGIRNGQDLAALLGYQLERGLHERYPGIELDEFIYVLRQRFPLISKKVTAVPDGTPAEMIEARNVINGYDLLDFIRGKSYPYGISELPTDAERAAAIRSELDRLADAMDAVGDLVLAESVHQIVQGNYERANGALRSITDGEAPPLPEVVTTPRSGKAVTQRVLLPLTVGGGWSASLTARATANPRVNHWLTRELPPADQIQWKFKRYGHDPDFVSFADLDLEPIDVVLMAGDVLGDNSSELERYLVVAYRRSHNVDDAVITFFRAQTDPQVAAENALIVHPDQCQPGKLSLESVLPLLRTLRHLITRCRALHALDYFLPSEADNADAANPKGYDDGTPPLQDLTELKQRIEAAYRMMADATAALKQFHDTRLQPLYDALTTDPNRVLSPSWAERLDTLRTHLATLCRAGMPEALPASGGGVTEAIVQRLVGQADSVLALAERRLSQARMRLQVSFPEPLPTDPTEAARVTAQRIDARCAAYIDAAQQFLGASFTPVPLFRFHTNQRAELAQAITSPVARDPMAIDTWLQSLVRVRPKMENVGWLCTYHEWIHEDRAALVPVQLPFRSNDSWLGGEVGDVDPTTESIVLTLYQPAIDVDDVQAGLLLDDWVEVLPLERETTGLAFHFNRPNAVAPQALLVAVAPELRGHWKWDDLLAIVSETLEHAQFRAVEPDDVAATDYFQFLPATVAELSKVPPVIVSNVTVTGAITTLNPVE